MPGARARTVEIQPSCHLSQRDRSRRLLFAARGFSILHKDEAVHMTAAAARDDEAADLARAIMRGVNRRPVQSFGEYFGEDGGSDALGAAYEGIFLLPRDVRGYHPRVWRLFDFLESTARHCPAGCHKYLPVAALMVHLNDDHHWTREQIADWVRSASPQ